MIEEEEGRCEKGGGGTWEGGEGKNREKSGSHAAALNMCGCTMSRPWGPSTDALDPKIGPEMLQRGGERRKRLG